MFLFFLFISFTIFKCIYEPCHKCSKRVLTKGNAIRMAVSEDAVHDFYEKCSY